MEVAKTMSKRYRFSEEKTAKHTNTVKLTCSSTQWKY